MILSYTCYDLVSPLPGTQQGDPQNLWLTPQPRKSPIIYLTTQNTGSLRNILTFVYSKLSTIKCLISKHTEYGTPEISMKKSHSRGIWYFKHQIEYKSIQNSLPPLIAWYLAVRLYSWCWPNPTCHIPSSTTNKKRFIHCGKPVVWFPYTCTIYIYIYILLVRILLDLASTQACKERTTADYDWHQLTE